MPNPNIAEAGRATRFQKGNAAAKDRTKAPSFRNYVRWLGGQRVEGDFIKSLDKAASNAATLEEWLAISLWRRAYEGSWKAIRRLTYIIDGPTPTRQQVEWEEMERRTRFERERAKRAARHTCND